MNNLRKPFDRSLFITKIHYPEQHYENIHYSDILCVLYDLESDRFTANNDSF